MAIVKQKISDWPGSNGKMMSHSSSKLTFFEIRLDVVRVFLSQFGVIL